MVLKLLFFLIILYYVLRTTGRLIRALRGEDGGSRLGRERSNGWENAQETRSKRDEDVEDAKFVDL